VAAVAVRARLLDARAGGERRQCEGCGDKEQQGPWACDAPFFVREQYGSPTRAVSRCRFCNGDSEHVFDASDRNQRVSAEQFSYHRCRRCETVFLPEIPPDLGRYYPPSYYPPLPRHAELERRARAHKWRIDLVRAHVSSGRLVEVGASVGFFAHLAKAAGFEVIAIEMDPRCCAYLREVVGVKVLESDDPVTALGARDGADAITLWHVLEHVDRPAELLAAAADALVPGGVLVVATPHLGSLQFRLLGARWPHIDAPRHLALVPLATLEERTAELGLEREAVTTADPAGEYDAFGWQGLLPGRARGHLSHLTGRLIGLIAAPVERRDLNGSACTSVFRKRMHPERRQLHGSREPIPRS
jgi:2-polyprenyl-3-methyl-5-hydroxy-6-metoxy-1,4-benzoquinol methylase